MKRLQSKLCFVSERVWIDPPGRYQPRAVLIENGFIRELREPVGAAALDPGWRVIDLGAQPLLPGLINTHVLLEFSASSRPLDEYLRESAEQRLQRAIANAREMLESGVTTLRDCGSSVDLFTLARWPDLHPYQLPRVILSGPPITVRRGHLHMMGGEAEEASEIDAQIDRNIRNGARSIKLMGSGGGMTPGTRPEAAAYPQDAFDQIARRARDAGVPGVVHALAPESIQRGARARVDSLEHCAFFARNADGSLERRFNSDIAGELRDSGVRVMANLSTATRALDRLRDNPRASPEAQHQLRQFDVMIENFSRMHAMGIPFVCGDDAGVRDTPFGDTAREMLWLQRAGLTAMETIRSATTEAAAALRLNGRIGRIATNYSADLIALPDDPLMRLESLLAPHWIVASGKIVKSPPPESVVSSQAQLS